MPPGIQSRFLLCDGLTDGAGVLFMTDREPYRFRNLADTRVHIVGEGDTLWSLAARYFAPAEDACLLWWVIADFQPEPIFDPTIGLAPGSTLYIPSLRTFQDQILSEARRNDMTL